MPRKRRGLEQGLELASAWLVAAFFLAASSFKLFEPETLVRALAQLPSLPDLGQAGRRLLSGAVTGMEAYVGIALLLRLQVRFATQVAIVLLAGFTILVAPFYEFLGGECGCVWRWIPLKVETGASLILRNALLTTSACLSLFLHDRRSESPRASLPVWTWVVLALAYSGSFYGWKVALDFSPTVDASEQSSARMLDTEPQLDESGRRDVTSAASLSGAQRQELVARGSDAGGKDAALVRVVDDRGGAVPGARVLSWDALPLIFPDRFELDLQPFEVLGATDENGEVRVQFERGTRVAVVATGHIPSLSPLQATTTVRLEQAHDIKIRVESLDAIPVTGPEVYLEMASLGWDLATAGAYFLLGTADDLGNFAFPLEAGARGLVKSPLHAPRYFTVGGDESIIQLAPLSLITGYVRGSVGEESFLVLADPIWEGGVAELHAVDPSGFGLELGRGVPYLLTPCAGTPRRFSRIGDSIRATPPESVVLDLTPGCLVAVSSLDELGRAIPPRLRASLLPDVVLASSSNAQLDDAGTWTWRSLRVPAPTTRSLWLDSPGFRPVRVGPFDFTPGGTVQLGTVVLERQSPLQVRVTSRSDQLPVVGAQVYVLSEEQPLDAETGVAGQIATTDSSGVAILQDPGVPSRLAVRKEGWLPYEHTLLPSDPLVEVQVELDQPAVVLVRFRALDGEPMLRGSVLWREPGRQWDRVFVEAGVARLEVFPGDVELRWSGESVKAVGPTGRVEIDLGEDSEEPVSLLVTNLRSGEIRELWLDTPVLSKLQVWVSSDGQPAPGLRVAIVPGERLDPSGSDLWRVLDVPRGRTGNDGGCTLLDVPLGSSTVFVEGAQDGQSWRFHEFLSGSKALALEVPTRDLLVTVLDERGAPVAGVNLCVSVQSMGSVKLPLVRSSSLLVVHEDPERKHCETTGESGEARFTSIASDQPLRISAAEPSRFPTLAPLLLSEVPDGPLELRLGTAAWAEVRVETILGGSVSGVGVLLRRQGARPSETLRQVTDDSGSVCFPALLPGQWQVVTPWGETQELTLRPGEAGKIRLLKP